METLAVRIRQELNAYQTQVAEKLEELFRQGLISQKEMSFIALSDLL